MRTYTRKKPDYQLIEGVHQLCRLCLEHASSSVAIFTDDSGDKACGSLPLRIMMCVGLEMIHDECLPNAICLDCYETLEKYYTFRKKCEMTYQKLKSHVLAVREREHQNALHLKNKENYSLEVNGKVSRSEEGQIVQHLVLSYNGEQPLQLVNVGNEVQLGNLQEFNSLTNGTIKQLTLNNQHSEVQLQDAVVSNENLPILEMESPEMDMPMILSTILVELGVLQQREGELVLVDEGLKTVELEGHDNSKVILELVEEDEEETTPNNQEAQLENNCKEQKEDTRYMIVKKPFLNKFCLKNIVKDKSKEKDVGSRACATCGKVFASRSVAARHQRVHSGERPFACGVCDRRFAQREVMTRHELVHQELRPFACPRCPKSFTQRGALAVHARLHAPAHARALALHRCQYCAKVFLYASGLSRHMTVHSGKVFVCNSCDRHFRDKSSLLRHLRKAHRLAD